MQQGHILAALATLMYSTHQLQQVRVFVSLTFSMMIVIAVAGFLKYLCNCRRQQFDFFFFFFWQRKYGLIFCVNCLTLSF